MLYVSLMTGGLVIFLSSETSKTRVGFFVSLHKMMKKTKSDVEYILITCHVVVYVTTFKMYLLNR